MDGASGDGTVETPSASSRLQQLATAGRDIFNLLMDVIVTLLPGELEPNKEKALKSACQVDPLSMALDHGEQLLSLCKDLSHFNSKLLERALVLCQVFFKPKPAEVSIERLESFKKAWKKAEIVYSMDRLMNLNGQQAPIPQKQGISDYAYQLAELDRERLDRETAKKKSQQSGGSSRKKKNRRDDDDDG